MLDQDDASFLGGGLYLTENGFAASKGARIKVARDKATEIEAALREANGRATRHTFTAFGEIERIAERGEKALESIGIPKADRPGARYASVSGSCLPSAYNYKARATNVVLIRRSSAWWLEHVAPFELHPKTTPGDRLELTREQDAKAIAVLRRHYTIRSEPV